MSLRPGDTVECIAPASKFNPEYLPVIEALLQSWGLKVKFSCALSPEEWLCSTDVKTRVAILQNALNDPTTKAIWAIMGGYGCSQLIPYLDQMEKPKEQKLLMGFSDVTILHLFFQKKWGWQTLHAPGLGFRKTCPTSIGLLKELLLEKKPYYLEVESSHEIPQGEVCIVGGNLSLVTCTLGTPWQIETQGKYLFLEETGERAYRIDRMLEHLSQAGVLKNIQGIILGQFIQKETKEMDEQTQKLFSTWIPRFNAPVYLCQTGHGVKNDPIPLNSPGVFLKKRVF